MLLLESERQAIRQELEKVLASPGFARNERLSRFLRFVVEGHLEGKDLELKESVIAVEVFGRSPDFDSRLDPVVRTEADRECREPLLALLPRRGLRADFPRPTDFLRPTSFP